MYESRGGAKQIKAKEKKKKRERNKKGSGSKEGLNQTMHHYIVYIFVMSV